MKKIAVFLLIIFVALVAAEETERIDRVKIPQEIIKQLDIEVKEVKKRDMTIVKKYPAIVKDDLTLSEAIYSPVSGLVKRLFVKEGDKVKKGQKLALVYSPQVIQVLSNLYLSKVNFENAKKVYEREKQLYENQVIPYTRYFNAMVEYENAKGEVKALEKTLKSFGEIENELIVLRAGINGYIAEQGVILGDSVDLSKQIFKIHSHEQLWTVAFVPVEDLQLFEVGNNVKIISSIGETTGTVDFISHNLDEDTRRNPVRIISDNRKDVLKPNMFVDVVISKRIPTNLYIPVSAVAYQDDKTLSFLFENGEFYPVEVKVGKRYGEYYQVLEGLKEGQKVVVDGTVHLKAKFFGEAEE